MHDHDGYDEVIAGVVAELREPVPIGPALDARIMERVREIAPHRWRSVLQWWTRPRPLRLSPLVGLAAAATLAAVVFAAGQLFDRAGQRGRPVPEHGTLAPAEGAQVVQFVLVAPNASTVAVVGDFNGWDPSQTPLHMTASGGIWSVNVPLRPGQHQYAFVVDGKEWRPDPTAPQAVTDDFGSPNSVIVVGGKST